MLGEARCLGNQGEVQTTESTTLYTSNRGDAGRQNRVCLGMEASLQHHKDSFSMTPLFTYMCLVNGGTCGRRFVPQSCSPRSQAPPPNQLSGPFQYLSPIILNYYFGFHYYYLHPNCIFPIFLPSSSQSFSPPFLCSPIHSFSISIQKKAGLPWHIKLNTRHLPLY